MPSDVIRELQENWTKQLCELLNVKPDEAPPCPRFDDCAAMECFLPCVIQRIGEVSLLAGQTAAMGSEQHNYSETLQRLIEFREYIVNCRRRTQRKVRIGHTSPCPCPEYYGGCGCGKPSCRRCCS